ncbi:MAG: ParA family protein [Spirochaetaceae bacterium]|jgi:chromosome partitioning protein|nr:ParA family protein [Spirochaetaceae bacterium]
MKEIIAFINQKGGVGKTTSVAGVAAGLQRKGFKTLLIDMDPQGNLSYISQADSSRPGSLELLLRKSSLGDAIRQTPQGDLIAASQGLAAEGILSDTGKEYRLREALEGLGDTYDFILIDCPPSLGILAINALTAATGIVIPVQADVLSLQALGQFSRTLEAVRRYTNQGLKLYGILLTRYSSRTVLSQEVFQMIEATAGQLGTKVFKTPIREAIVVKEAQAARTDIFTHAPKSNAAQDFESVTAELLKDLGSK